MRFVNPIIKQAGQGPAFPEDIANVSSPMLDPRSQTQLIKNAPPANPREGGRFMSPHITGDYGTRNYSQEASLMRTTPLPQPNDNYLEPMSVGTVKSAGYRDILELLGITKLAIYMERPDELPNPMGGGLRIRPQQKTIVPAAPSIPNRVMDFTAPGNRPAGFRQTGALEGTPPSKPPAAVAQANPVMDFTTPGNRPEGFRQTGPLEGTPAATAARGRGSRPLNLNAPVNKAVASQYSPEQIANWNRQYQRKQQRLAQGQTAMPPAGAPRTPAANEFAYNANLGSYKPTATPKPRPVSAERLLAQPPEVNPSPQHANLRRSIENFRTQRAQARINQGFDKLIG